MELMVEKIIKDVGQGFFFDAHFVISKLIETDSDSYLKKFTTGNTASYHSELARAIKIFEGVLVEQQEGKSWSKNIHDNYSECSLWKRI